MIGRTNVPQRKSPTINGDIANFTVANGNTISVGDFVSYKLMEEIKTFNNNTYNKDFVLPYDEENDKYVVCLKGGTGNTEKLIQLVQVVNGDVEILDTISVIVSSTFVVSINLSFFSTIFFLPLKDFVCEWQFGQSIWRLFKLLL